MKQSTCGAVFCQPSGNELKHDNTIPLISNFNYSFSFFVYRLFDIYEPGVCHFIDHEASLSNLSPSLDPSHVA